MKTITIKLNLGVDLSKAPAGVDLEQTIVKNIKAQCSLDNSIFKDVSPSVRAFKVTVEAPEDF